MFAVIIPRINLPSNVKNSEFDYLIPEKLEKDIKIGQVIEVSFKNKKVQGLIVDIKEKSEVNSKFIKPILKIINKDFIASTTQISIINFLSENYFINKSLALKTVIPIIPKKLSKVE